MSWLARFGSNVKRNLPSIAGDLVEVGIQAGARSYGLDDIASKEIAYVVGMVAKTAVTSAMEVQPSSPDQHAVLRIAKSPDPSVTPCWFVYAMPVKDHRVESRVTAVAPRVWTSPQMAWLYAEHVANAEMGFRVRPDLLVGDEPVVEGGADPLTEIAWEQWMRERKDDPRPVAKNVIFGSYVIGELPQGGFVAWAPVLTQRGVRVGTMTRRWALSLEDPPQVFETEERAIDELRSRNIQDPIDVVFLPNSLATELQIGESGELNRVASKPNIWPSDPILVKPERRLPPGPDPSYLRPDWYVSKDTNDRVWAWRMVGEDHVSFARLRRPDGTWATATWPSVDQCLKDLGSIGAFGQEHPTLVVAPQLPAKVTSTADLSV